MHTLKQGHTAVVRTKEQLHLSNKRAAIAFPPSHVSLRGLLMTNPGHVDPGYEGPLHCTVINMGRLDYPLSAGDRIMRVLIFELDTPARASFSERAIAAGVDPRSPQITSELLERLSFDFVDVEKRATDIANGAVLRAGFIAAAIPILVALVGWFATVSPGIQSAREDIIKNRAQIDSMLPKLEEKSDVHQLEQKINAISAELAALKIQIEQAGKNYDRMQPVENRLRALEEKMVTVKPN